MAPACLRLAGRAVQTAGAASGPGKVLPMTLPIVAPDGAAQVPVTVSRLRRWKPDEEAALLGAIAQVEHKHGTIVWREVARHVPDRTAHSCRQRYERLIEHSSSSIAPARATRTRRSSAHPPARYRTRVSLGTRSPRYWSPEETERLLQLHAIYGRKWTYIATLMEGRSPQQCGVRARYLREKETHPARKRGPKAKAADGAAAAQGTHPAWNRADSDRLRALVAAHGRYDYGELAPHFPGVDYHQMYAAMMRLMEAPGGNGHRRWRTDERRAVLRLAHEHNHDWIAVAMRMPSPRTPTQCRQLYGNIMLGHAQSRRAWTRDECERLAHLVDLATRGELAPSLLRVAPARPLALGAGADLPRRFQHLPGLPADEPPPPLPGPGRPRPALPWALIASHMDARSAVQCRAQWRQQGMVARHAADAYSGPWSLEEDRLLYSLHLEAPGKWTWILRRLPRRRARLSVVHRYRHHIGHFVDMLRACRGPAWDPLADGFEEVHLRCEIRAWFAARSEGYRPQDPYECPYDIDLTGRSMWAAAAPAQTSRPWSYSSRKRGGPA